MIDLFRKRWLSERRREARADKESAEIYGLAKRMFDDGDELEEVICFLKENGISQGLSSFFLTQMGAGTPGDCKAAIIMSDAWAENREANLKLQGELGDD